MGCVKSKRSDNANSSERAKGAAHSARSAHAGGETGSPPPPQSDLEVDPALLDFAHKLSEEIVARAVQQWAELDRRYCDIPYIECDD